MSNFEQFIRIALNAGGAYIFGDAIASGEMYQAAIGGVVSLASFGWWLYRKNSANNT
jgi:hypothetical protein